MHGKLKQKWVIWFPWQLLHPVNYWWRPHCVSILVVLCINVYQYYSFCRVFRDSVHFLWLSCISHLFSMTRDLHCCCQVEKLYLVITPLMIAVFVFWILIYMPLFKASWRCGDFGDFVVVTIQFSSVRKGLNFYPINFSFVTWESSFSIYFLVLIRICPVVLVTSCTEVTYLDPTTSQSIKLLVTPPRSVFEFSAENER